MCIWFVIDNNLTGFLIEMQEEMDVQCNIISKCIYLSEGDQGHGLL